MKKFLDCFGYKYTNTSSKVFAITENDNTNTKKEDKKYKKKSIPATVKRLVWNTYIGENIGKTKCLCCNVTDITQMSFHCGHVLAEANGGLTIVNNLRPICQNCNSSMRTTNMDDFKKLLQLDL